MPASPIVVIGALVCAVLGGFTHLGPPEMIFFEQSGLARSFADPPTTRPLDETLTNPSLNSRKKDAYARAISFIRQERFAEALTFIRKQPTELRNWPGLAVLEAGLLTASEPQEAIEKYYAVINQKQRDLHWGRAMTGYRLAL
ncbi:MAG: hypothetical protein LBT62_06460, partial [Deltaproteobacteria bacterium]|nr:hypothetical protein [Deltaproteobacteria bacterium]